VKAVLVLEDGSRFEGDSFGSPREAAGKVVPYTSMAGYQEALTDPSNRGLLLCMTYPLIGNCGVNREDAESSRGQPGGLIVRDLCREPLHWRGEKNLHRFLQEEEIAGIKNVDTRALSRHIYRNGAMYGAIVAGDRPCLSPHSLIDKTAPERMRDAWENPGEDDFFDNLEKISGNPAGSKVAVLDLGVRRSLLRAIKRRCNRVSLFSPATVKNISPSDHEGLIIAGGGWSPLEVAELLQEDLDKILGKLPVLGISLGMQVLARLLGGELKEMPAGHRGDNYPVRKTGTDSVLITSQNHGWLVEEEALDARAKITYRQLHDHSVEGISYPEKGIEGIQFWPEISFTDNFFNVPEVEKFIQAPGRRG